MSIKNIAELIPSPRKAGKSVDIRTVQNVLNFYNHNGTTTSDRKKYQSSRSLTNNEKDELAIIIKDSPSLYLDEIRDELLRRCGRRFGTSTIHYELLRAKLTLKVMGYRAHQRNDNQRAEYWKAVYNFYDHGATKSSFVFLDETAKVDSALRRTKGRGLRGESVEGVQYLAYRSFHISVLAMYGHNGFVSTHFHEGGYNAEEFMDAVEANVIPHLNPFPQDNSVLVMDNCGIHHTYEDELRDMVHSRGAHLIFLAPYSPIDNPIETAFNVVKSFWIRNQGVLNQMSDVKSALDFCFEHCYPDPATSANKSFEKCGYHP